MKESQKVFNKSAKAFEKALAEWKNKEKGKAEKQFKLANYGMMKAYIISEGIMHMDGENSIHDTFQKIWMNDKVFNNSYAHELNYFDQFNNKRGYFGDNPELTTQLKNDFSKLYKKLNKIALSSIQKNPEDKFVPPDDIIAFVEDASNLMKDVQPKVVNFEKVVITEKPVVIEKPVATEESVKVEKPAKKGFFRSLFGKINIEVNGKKKK
jgi:hypothetical protein